MFRFSARPNRADAIHWREWSDDAFEEAAAQGKPMAVVICAYWCGSCQRLDETTFSDDGIIALLNSEFIPVRLEESQRPDVDVRYTIEGWPTIAFLTPRG